jgi:hypothetical protein
MRDNYYDTAQICLNGHVINTYASSFPESNEKHCGECGALTITGCVDCKAPIRGYYHVVGVFAADHYHKPSYCYNCGKPYPWTKASLDAAQELADELEHLNAEERQQLKDSLPDLLKDTPRTAVAETRFKKLMKKAGAEAFNAMRSILIDIVSEAVRKSVFGS